MKRQHTCRGLYNRNNSCWAIVSVVGLKHALSSIGDSGGAEFILPPTIHSDKETQTRHLHHLFKDSGLLLCEQNDYSEGMAHLLQSARINNSSFEYTSKSIRECRAGKTGISNVKSNVLYAYDQDIPDLSKIVAHGKELNSTKELGDDRCKKCSIITSGISDYEYDELSNASVKSLSDSQMQILLNGSEFCHRGEICTTYNEITDLGDAIWIHRPSAANAARNYAKQPTIPLSFTINKEQFHTIVVFVFTWLPGNRGGHYKCYLRDLDNEVDGEWWWCIDDQLPAASLHRQRVTAGDMHKILEGGEGGADEVVGYIGMKQKPQLLDEVYYNDKYKYRYDRRPPHRNAEFHVARACQYCNKEYKTPNRLSSHQSRCPHRPRETLLFRKKLGMY